VERKLTAILCADVFGYSRLMGGDEEATLVTLTAHRRIIDSLIEQRHGRFVNSAGDSVLAEFASVLDASIARWIFSARSRSRTPGCRRRGGWICASGSTSAT
jgi:class 3 adenylate cyclase